MKRTGEFGVTTTSLAIVAVIIAIVVGLGIYSATRPAETPHEGITVGFSLGAYGWPWRTQHVDDFKMQAEKYQAREFIKDYYIRVAGGEVSAQISDIKGLIAEGVDLLVINANSATALNPVIEEAHEAGIIVVAQDQHVTSPYAYNVVINHVDWFADITEWVCEQLNGKGNIVIVTGAEGHPANDERMKGCYQILEKYPDINVLAVIEGAWSFSIAEERFGPVLAAHKGEINAVLMQDGHFLGIVSALEAAKIKPGDPDFPKIMTGDYTLACLQKWKEIKDVMPEFKCYMRLNTPGYSADGLMIGVRLAQEREINFDYELIDTETYPGITFRLSLPPTITNEDVDRMVEEYKYQSATYQVDYIISEEDADAYFK